MNKKYLIMSLALAALAIGTFSAENIYARSADDTGQNIVQRIAARFNLNEADVQTVFDEKHEEMKQDRQKKLEEKLNSLVSEEKLTGEQKNALLAKLSEMQDIKVDFKDLSKDEIKTKMEQERTNFENWLKENNIDKEILGGIGFMRGGPKAGGHRFNEKPL